MSWKCKGCGKCCKMIKLNISAMPEDQKLWLSYHEKCIVDGDMLIIKVKCRHLKRKNRRYYCEIYATRPEMCREAGERECGENRWLYDANKA